MIPSAILASTQTLADKKKSTTLSLGSKVSSRQSKPVMRTVSDAHHVNQTVSGNNEYEFRSSHISADAENPVLRRAQTLPAKYVAEILCGGSGLLSREQIIAYSNSGFSKEEVRRIPRTWPAELISAHDLMIWSDALVRAHLSVYENSGGHAYAEAVMAVVFPDDEVKAWNLPDKLIDFLAAVDKQVLRQTHGLDLSLQEMRVLRFRVQAGFLFGRVFFPHLRPFAVRNRYDYQSLQHMDSLIAQAANKKLIYFYAHVMNVADHELSAEALKKRSAAPSVSEQIGKLIGRQKLNMIHPESIDSFYQVVSGYLESSIGDKIFLIRCAHTLFSFLPQNHSEAYERNRDAAINFIYSSRHRLDNLNREAKRYFMRHLVMINMPDRHETLSRSHLKAALLKAERILPSLAEQELEDDSQ